MRTLHAARLHDVARLRLFETGVGQLDWRTQEPSSGGRGRRSYLLMEVLASRGRVERDTAECMGGKILK